MVDEAVLRRGAPGLRAYVVWVPILDGDDRRAASAAAARWPAARHFWDEGGHLSRAVGRLLGVPRDGRAWDVYLVYPRAARWTAGGPPRPAAWLHQLAGVDPAVAPVLDGERLRAAIEREEARGITQEKDR